MAEPSTFLDGRTISRRLKLRAGQLHELVSAGRVRLFDGGRYDVEQVRAAVFGETQQSTQSHQSIEAEETEHEDSTAFALRMMREQAQSAQLHAEKMFAMAVAALESSNKALREENSALRGREKENHEAICSLQDRHVKNLEAHEKVLSLAHEREMQTELVKGVNSRRQQGVDMLKNALPVLLDSVKATFEQKSLIGQFFKTLHPGQLEAIMSIDFFTEEQKAVLQKLIASTNKPKPAAKTQPSAENAQTHGSEPAAA